MAHMQIGELLGPLWVIADPQLRLHKLLHEWSSAEPAPWIEALAATFYSANVFGDSVALATLETLTRAAGDCRLPYAARQRFYESAFSSCRPLERLFLAASPNTVEAHQLAKQLAVERPLAPRERPLSLGERKSLARTQKRGMLMALCKDPHPAVVEILLGNPYVTEPDVVRIAALRPSVPASLTLVADHPRWSTRTVVKRALAWNPATPLHVAVRLVTTLRGGELREIVAAPSLPAPLRSHASELLDLLISAAKYYGDTASTN